MTDGANRIATIILAAGCSSRMEGRFKPSLKLGPVTVVEQAIRSHLDAGLHDIRVVVGDRANEVVEAVRHLGVTTIMNNNFEKGMFSSIQTGVESLTPEIAAFFIRPADIPLVHPATIRAMVDRFAGNTAGIIYPVYRGERGHPPLISSCYASEILASSAPDGLRGILIEHEPEAIDVDVDDQAILMDMDTPNDYRNLLDYKGRHQIPDPETCMGILEKEGVGEAIKEHALKVAQVADQLTRLLNAAGACLDRNLVETAALLHDVKRNQKDHASAGAHFLRRLGYALVADIVSVHMDIVTVENAFPTEAEIVYLADKLVMGSDCVPLEKRFAAALNCNRNEAVIKNILRRKTQAERIKKKVEDKIGCLLEDVLNVEDKD